MRFLPTAGKYSITLWRTLLALCIVMTFSSIFLLSSCRESKKTHVIVMWATDAQDPVYRNWASILEKEFKRQDIDAEMHYYYGILGGTMEAIEKTKLSNMVRSLTAEGKEPSLILLYGDYLHWLLDINPDSAVRKIPAVCFGLSTPRYYERMQNILSRDSLGHCNAICITDSFCLKKNVDFADTIANIHTTDSIATWFSKFPRHRFITLLDSYSVWTDTLLYLNFEKQLATLDTTEYLDNFHNGFEEGDLRKITQGPNHKKEIIFKTLRNPAKNHNFTLKYQTMTTWAFYAQKSPYIYIQSKHDNSTRSCTEGPNFPPYFTMTATDFENNDSCVGGYFASFESQAKDAVDAGKRLLEGEDAKKIGILRHRPDYHLNWNILREKGLSVYDVPQYAKLHNTTFADYYPQTFVILCIVGGVIFFLIMICVISYSFNAILKMRRDERIMHDNALQAIRQQQVVEDTIRICGASTWSEQGHDYALLSRMDLNEFYKKKLEEMMYKTADGTYTIQFPANIDGKEQQWYDLRMEIRHNDEGEIERHGVLVNIYRQKELEAKAIETHRLKLNTQAREGFISAMSHEIRTPLNAVVGHAQVLSMPEIAISPEELTEYAFIIEDNAASLKKMIDDLLLVTLMSNSNIAAKKEECSMASLMDPANWAEAMNMTRRHHNNVVFLPSASDTTIMADRNMMARIMENLINNASKFSEDGSTITVSWSTTPSREGAKVEIKVADEGVGIEQQYHDLIFERFFKINSFIPGCGLGLHIVKTYVEMMGGKISIESKRNNGTTISLFFS